MTFQYCNRCRFVKCKSLCIIELMLLFYNLFGTGQYKVGHMFQIVICVPLFPNKVYHLASVRLRDLCHKLDISDDLRKKIWTCFEFSLVHCSDLMKGRHLDQLLMCAVYVMARVRH